MIRPGPVLAKNSVGQTLAYGSHRSANRSKTFGAIRR